MCTSIQGHSYTNSRGEGEGVRHFLFSSGKGGRVYSAPTNGQYRPWIVISWKMLAPLFYDRIRHCAETTALEMDVVEALKMSTNDKRMKA